MKTKAVYVVVSGDNDIYFEQAWVSAWSLKHYNPEMWVECVVDQDTYANIVGGYRKKALEVIDDLVKIDVPTEFTKKEQSRWLKTNLRNLIQGDYLFIDTDTVICDKLDEIDDFEHDVMMVRDNHCDFEKMPSCKITTKLIKKINGADIPITNYYNSGVMYVKDTPAALELYKDWHTIWRTAVKKGISTDQQSLVIARQGKDVVKEMSGVYNCQIRLSLKYLYKAKIVHFYTSKWYQDCIHPFFGNQLYLKLKEEKQIGSEMRELILDCKSLFIAPTLTIAEEELTVRNSRAFSFLVRIYKQYPRYYSFIQWTALVQQKILSGIRKINRVIKQ